jgi:hypothetical protein
VIARANVPLTGSSTLLVSEAIGVVSLTASDVPAGIVTSRIVDSFDGADAASAAVVGAAVAPGAASGVGVDAAGAPDAAG